jgi:UDP-N-acetylbacillosamine N-acetyltransferase
MKSKLIIYGNSQYASLMNYYFSVDSEYDVKGFTVDKQYITEDHLECLPVVPFELVEKVFPPEEYKMFVAIGYRRMRNRPILLDKAKKKRYKFINYISSKSITYNDLIIGENNVILGNVDIEPGVVMGDNNIIWSDTLVGHNTIIGNHNYISAKCCMAGQIVVGDLCFVGNGAVTINKLTIEDEAHIFPGAVLLEDAKKGGRYKGNPAQYIGSHKGDGIIIKRG